MRRVWADACGATAATKSPAASATPAWISRAVLRLAGFELCMTFLQELIGFLVEAQLRSIAKRTAKSELSTQFVPCRGTASANREVGLAAAGDCAGIAADKSRPPGRADRRALRCRDAIFPARQGGGTANRREAVKQRRSAARFNALFASRAPGDGGGYFVPERAARNGTSLRWSSSHSASRAQRRLVHRVRRRAERKAGICSKQSRR